MSKDKRLKEQRSKSEKVENNLKLSLRHFIFFALHSSTRFHRWESHFIPISSSNCPHWFIYRSYKHVRYRMAAMATSQLRKIWAVVVIVGLKIWRRDHHRRRRHRSLHHRHTAPFSVSSKSLRWMVAVCGIKLYYGEWFLSTFKVNLGTGSHILFLNSVWFDRGWLVGAEAIFPFKWDTSQRWVRNELWVVMRVIR